MVKHTLKKSCGVHTARFLNYVWPLWKRKTCKHLRNFDQISQNLGHTYVNIEVFQQKQRVKRKLLQHWYNVQKQPFADALQNRCTKNFTKLTGKHLCWSLFLIKLQTWRPSTVLKKRLQHRCFPVNITKSLWTGFFIKTLFLSRTRTGHLQTIRQMFNCK